MPAWPAPAHDDEVWATVAFLRALPSMDAALYDALAGRAGQPAGNELKTAIAYCDRCHAEGRRMAGSLVPALSGQSPQPSGEPAVVSPGQTAERNDGGGGQ